jgi:prefoldin subunit 5
MEALDESTEKLESVQSEISDLEGQIKDLNESKTDVTDEENGKEIGTPDMLLSDMPAYNLNLHH